MTVVKVVEDIAFGAHWPCQSIGRGLCAKVQTGGSPRASREPLVASADMPSVGPEKDRHFSQCVCVHLCVQSCVQCGSVAWPEAFTIPVHAVIR